MLQPVSTLQRQTHLRSATNSELFVTAYSSLTWWKSFQCSSRSPTYRHQASCHSTNI